TIGSPVPAGRCCADDGRSVTTRPRGVIPRVIAGYCARTASTQGATYRSSSLAHLKAYHIETIRIVHRKLCLRRVQASEGALACHLPISISRMPRTNLILLCQCWYMHPNGQTPGAPHVQASATRAAGWKEGWHRGFYTERHEAARQPRWGKAVGSTPGLTPNKSSRSKRNQAAVRDLWSGHGGFECAVKQVAKCLLERAPRNPRARWTRGV